MARFTSILFTDPDAVARLDELEQPECFADLLVDQIITDITHGNADKHLDRFFYVPLHDVSAVAYRHEVFRDLDRDHIRAPIEAFVTGMRTMRDRLDRTAHLWHRLQKQGWFVYAVEAFCDTVSALRDALARIDPSSHGLREFADYVASYVDSDRFQTLVTETAAVQAELHNIRYTVHIEGLKVHVEKYDGQNDYSADIATTFERFASQTTPLAPATANMPRSNMHGYQ